MKDIKVILDLLRSTKGTHLYATDMLGAGITSLYIKKGSMPSTPPMSIVVTVSINGEVKDGD